MDLNFDWGPESPLWTEQAKQKVKPDLDSDETFFMSYEDFVVNFDLVHICMIDKFQEIQTKGIFKIFGMDHFFTTKKSLLKSRASLTPEPESLKVCSLFHYMVNIQEDGTELTLGVHQEDANNSGVRETQPYLDLGTCPANRQA